MTADKFSSVVSRLQAIVAVEASLPVGHCHNERVIVSIDAINKRPDLRSDLVGTLINDEGGLIPAAVLKLREYDMELVTLKSSMTKTNVMVFVAHQHALICIHAISGFDLDVMEAYGNTRKPTGFFSKLLNLFSVG